MRMYSLYERARGAHRWQRISERKYPLTLAIHVFQSRLLDYMLAGDMTIERRLRPVND
jgi:hypothetical protein